MAHTTVFFDLPSVRDQVGTVLKEAIDKFIEHITAIATSKGNEKAQEADIAGMRAQIIANVEVLLPIISSGSKHGFSFAKGDHWAVKPDLHIITVGETPQIKAYALQGSVTCCEKVIDGDAGATTSEALNNLLALTQQKLHFHFDDIGMSRKQSSGDAVHGSGLPAGFVDKHWDSDEITNPNFPGFSFAPGNGSFGRDDSGDSAIGDCGRNSYALVSPSASATFSTSPTLYDFMDNYYAQ